MHRLLLGIMLLALLLSAGTVPVLAKQAAKPHPRATATPTLAASSPPPSAPTNTPTTAPPSATATSTPAATTTAQLAAGKLRYRSVDLMKATKDMVDNQPSDSQIAAMVAGAKAMNVTHIAFSVPLDSNADFVQYGNKPSPRTIENFTLAWANAVHATGLHILFRGTLSTFEQGGSVAGCGTNGHVVVGIYNFPFYVAGQCSTGNGAGGLQTESWWLNRLQTRLTALAQLGVFQPGDILAPLPEPQSNQNFWDSAWNFLAMVNDPSLYASFFDSAKQAEDAALASAGVSGVQTGFTADNGSMFLSGPGSAGGGTWVPVSYERGIGTLNVDHYGSDGYGGNPQYSWQEMLCGLQDIYSHYQTPILQQEWADTHGFGPSYVQSMLNNAFLPEIQAGAYVGLNYWDPGCGNPGSLFNCDYVLTATGQVLQAWFASLS